MLRLYYAILPDGPPHKRIEFGRISGTRYTHRYQWDCITDNTFNTDNASNSSSILSASSNRYTEYALYRSRASVQINMTGTSLINIKRIACIGAGYFSQFHYQAWARMPEVQIVGAMDMSAFAAQLTGYPAYTDLQDMLTATQPQLVDIITPPDTHLDFIKTALSHNVDAIICQKPFCNSLAEAREATALSKAAGIPLIIHENFRFQPWYRCIRQAIDEELLGSIHQITFRLRTGDGQGAHAYLDRQPYFQTMPRLLIHETGVHWIDTFRYLLGEPQSVYADLRTMNPAIAGEDAAYVLFDFNENKRALFDGNRLLDHAAENHRMTLGECLVEGTSGTLSIDGDGSVHHREFGKTTQQTILAAQQWPGFGGDCVYALQQHVLASLSAGYTPENTAEEYIRVLEIEAAVYQSADQHSRIML